MSTPGSRRGVYLSGTSERVDATLGAASWATPRSTAILGEAGAGGAGGDGGSRRFVQLLGTAWRPVGFKTHLVSSRIRLSYHRIASNLERLLLMIFHAGGRFSHSIRARRRKLQTASASRLLSACSSAELSMRPRKRPSLARARCSPSRTTWAMRATLFSRCGRVGAFACERGGGGRRRR